MSHAILLDLHERSYPDKTGAAFWNCPFTA